MTTNRLAKSDAPYAPQDADERRRYWIERGNQLLRENGRYDLEWLFGNGHYFIAPR